MIFYLGTHQEGWLGRVDVPLFLTRRRLAYRKKLQRALDFWALDSGGFTELNMYGKWETPPEQYADEISRLSNAIGSLMWAAPQDWMCEPHVIEKTGLSVREHQERTVESVLYLRSLDPGANIIPVLQGWTREDYHACMNLYSQAGIDLFAERTVGLGSICRRQRTKDIHELISDLHSYGLRLHGFGVKMVGLSKIASKLVSADSLAWSFTGRRNAPLPGHEVRHKNCANCLEYALLWRERVLEMMAG